MQTLISKKNDNKKSGILISRQRGSIAIKYEQHGYHTMIICLTSSNNMTKQKTNVKNKTFTNSFFHIIVKGARRKSNKKNFLIKKN